MDSLGRSHQYGRWPEPWEATRYQRMEGPFSCHVLIGHLKMLEVKMFSTMYLQGDEGNFRCQYNTRFLSSDKLGHTVCIYSWCLQLLFSVIILQMIVTYFICQKRVEESLSWQTLGVNRARQVEFAKFEFANFEFAKFEFAKFKFNSNFQNLRVWGVLTVIWRTSSLQNSKLQNLNLQNSREYKVMYVVWDVSVV